MFLNLTGSSDAELPRRGPEFLAELPAGATLADVAKSVLTRDGRLIGAIGAAVDASESDRLDAVGEGAQEGGRHARSEYGLQAS